MRQRPHVESNTLDLVNYEGWRSTGGRHATKAMP
jgi:hypothetical protein